MGGRVDETSVKVLREYLRDARQSFREVARRIGISSGTVASRVKDLEGSGVIRKYTVQLDYERMGYELTAVTEIIVSAGMMMEVGEKITRFPETMGVYNVTGDSDIMVVAKFKGRQQLSDFTKNVTKMPNVVRTKTHVVLNTLKEELNILL
ncbi:Lrp/AsnC family transcriptional regulator [Candidatus Bathyarchaeota archaeon]|nr:Lrp/AsnC family transcriptional regulator [Candidatus Bathyarchaeota archaeon]